MRSYNPLTIDSPLGNFTLKISLLQLNGPGVCVHNSTKYNSGLAIISFIMAQPKCELKWVIF